MAINIQNLELALKTAQDKLDYCLQELERAKAERQETQKMGFEETVAYIKSLAAEAWKKDKRPLINDDVMLIKKLEANCSGRWGKNVLAKMFRSIAKDAPRYFKCEVSGKTVYLRATG